MSLEQATQEYLNGTKMKDVLTKYPDLNRQKIYYNVRKVKKSFEAEERSEGVEKENVNGGNDAENGENIDANNVENENNNVEEIINSVKNDNILIFFIILLHKFNNLIIQVCYFDIII